jgi:hypothetical protein
MYAATVQGRKSTGDGLSPELIVKNNAHVIGP